MISNIWVSFYVFTDLSCRFLKCRLSSSLSLSLSLSPHLSVSRLHVSPGQQAGAVGIDDGVAMGTEGWDVREGGRVHRWVMRHEEAARGDLSLFLWREGHALRSPDLKVWWKCRCLNMQLGRTWRQSSQDVENWGASNELAWRVGKVLNHRVQSTAFVRLEGWGVAENVFKIYVIILVTVLLGTCKKVCFVDLSQKVQNYNEICKMCFWLHDLFCTCLNLCFLPERAKTPNAAAEPACRFDFIL